MSISTRICIATAALALLAPANAAIIPFDLLGKFGAGLLAGNENATIVGTPGSGGERIGGTGISFNDVSLVLSIDIAWGSGNGFTNLSGNATAGHIHGPTTSGGTASFTQDAPALIGLNSVAGWNANATNGGFTGNVTLTSTQATQLLAGRFYINVHTPDNGGGEIRGNLVQVPEPMSVAMFGLAGAVLAFGRRRSR